MWKFQLVNETMPGMQHEFQKSSSSQNCVYLLVPTVECWSFTVRHRTAVFTFIFHVLVESLILKHTKHYLWQHKQSGPSRSSISIYLCGVESWRLHRTNIENGLDSDVGHILCPDVKLVNWMIVLDFSFLVFSFHVKDCCLSPEIKSDTRYRCFSRLSTCMKGILNAQSVDFVLFIIVKWAAARLTKDVMRFLQS